ncbi:MAG: type IV pilus biogenesis/stability protein PilW [Nitrospinota bacterium]
MHLRMREFPQAISRYREALALMPGYGRGHLALARAYVLAGRREEALLTLVEGLPHLGASALAELEMDKDFAPLRRDLRFWKLVGKAPGGSAPIKRTKVKKSKRRPATPSGGPSFQPYFARVFVRGSPDPIPGRVRVVGERDGRVTVELVDLLRTRLSFPRGDVVIERFALPKGGVQ